MIEVLVCVGSSCHLKGAYSVSDAFEKLLAAQKCQNKVALKASFCMGDCVNGCCVHINGQPYHHITPQGVPALFEEAIRPLL